MTGRRKVSIPRTYDDLIRRGHKVRLVQLTDGTTYIEPLTADAPLAPTPSTQDAWAKGLDEIFGREVCSGN